MLRLAGFSAGRSVCARGGWSAGQSESIAAFCVRIMTGARFYRNVLRSVHAYRAFLSECLAFGSRLSHVSIGMSCVRFTPAVCRKAPNRTACAALRSYSAVGRDRHSCVLAALFGYLPLWVHFGIVRLFVAISTGLPGTLGYGAGGAAFVRLCAIILALQCFPRGVRWGSAPQTCAKESSTLWTLFTLRRGYVDTNTHPCKKRKRPNQRTHACKTRVHG